MGFLRVVSYPGDPLEKSSNQYFVLREKKCEDGTLETFWEGVSTIRVTIIPLADMAVAGETSSVARERGEKVTQLEFDNMAYELSRVSISDNHSTGIYPCIHAYICIHINNMHICVHIYIHT